MTWGPPLFLSCILVGLSFKWIFFVEFVAPVMFTGYYTMLVLINTEFTAVTIDSNMRQYQMNYLMMLHIIFTLFASASWLQGFLFRFPLFLIASMSLLAYRI